MQSLLLLLALPLSVHGADSASLAAASCDGPRPGSYPGSTLRAAADADELAFASGVLAPNLANAEKLNRLALVQFQTGRVNESAATTAAVGEIWRQATASAELAANLRYRARQHYQEANCNAALTLYAVALDMAQEAVSDRHVLTIGVMTELTHLHATLNRPQLARPLLARIEAALDAAPAIAASNPAINIGVADSAHRAAHFTMAEKYARAAMMQADTGTPNGHMLRPMNELAAALYGQGKVTEADQVRARAAAIATALQPRLDTRAPPLKDDQVALHFRAGEHAAALALATGLLDQAEAELQSRRGVLAALENDQSSPGSAAKWQAIAQARTALRALTWTMARRLADTADLHHARQDLAQAGPLYRRALATLRAERAEQSELEARISQGLGMLLRTTGSLAEAETLQKTAISINDRRMGSVHPEMLRSYAELAAIAAAQGKLEDAALQYAALIKTVQGLPQPDRTILGSLLLGLANVQLAQKNRAAAEASFRQVHALWHQGGTARDILLMASLGGLGAIYDHDGRLADSKEVRAQLRALRSRK